MATAEDCVTTDDPDLYQTLRELQGKRRAARAVTMSAWGVQPPGRATRAAYWPARQSCHIDNWGAPAAKRLR